MRRVGLIIGAGVAVALLFGVLGTDNSDAQARVTIETDQVQAVRGQVTASLESLGAQRVSEDTSFEGDGDATMTFAVPPDAFEQALAALADTGGVLVSQEVDLNTESTRSDEIGDQLASLQRCLGDAGTDPSALVRCEGDLSAARSELRAAGNDLDNISLEVDISSSGGTSALIVIGITMTVIGCLVAAAYYFVQRRRDDEGTVFYS